MSARHGKAEVYQDQAGEWRYRIVAANGETVSQSESYGSERDAARGLNALIGVIENRPPIEFVQFLGKTETL